MLTDLVREVSEGEYNEIINKVKNGKNVESSLYNYTSSGSKYKSIRYTDGERNLTVQVLPVETFQKVENEPVKTEVYAIIKDEDTDSVWMITVDDFESISQFPELRQAFHEGESFNEREANYKYHYEDGSTQVAVPTNTPVRRLKKPITITAIEFLGGMFPQEWIMETDDGEYLYLRERSGSIRLYKDGVSGEEIFNAYIGREHPGTNLNKDEVINIISSVEYINIVENPKEKVNGDVI